MKRNTGKKKFYFLIVGGLVISLVFNSAEAENKKVVEKRYSTVAIKPSGLELPGEMKTLNFKFNVSEISAWLRENGEWHIEGLISHHKLLCANYRLGIRFGQGNPGCIDVKWLTPEQFISNKKQCNNVQMLHGGNQSSPEVIPAFEKITCAQSIVKCEGSCE